MWCNRFSVKIVGGTERDNGYVALSHGKEYKLSLRNDRELPCDAVVSIDSKHIGTWRIEPHSNVCLERPADDHGRFTFYLPDTPEGRAAKLAKGDPNLGLVSVVFMPGYTAYLRPPKPLYPIPPWPQPLSDWCWWHYLAYGTWPGDNVCMRTSANYTVATAATCDTTNARSVSSVPAASAAPVATEFQAGGTGLSGHSHQEFGIAAPLIYDSSQQVTINLRLVGIAEAATVRPLAASSTPIPPPVE